MSIQIQIDSGIQDAEEVRFLLATTADDLQGIPSGKMITDSENLSFVYLLEIEEGYRQLHFTQPVWPLMLEVLKLDVDPVLAWQDKIVSLKGFKDELKMLIYNIEGNDNYGEAFSLAVEQAFYDILHDVD
ncbi:UPF0738 family protein [Sporosarcina beigongshangi]|uniref:UPF0738 family protein n=1 Tax=Sporosarcina beigongshangi TaxID=2782538 RepID=UPI00193ACC0C|nr:hypothetical protein [Sporosarcina beigongshangi]